MILIDTKEFHENTISWIKLHNSEYKSSVYFLENWYQSGIDDQILAEILGLTEVQ